MAIQIGKIIKEEVHKQEITVSSFAKKIHRSRNVVYDIFERESIDTALLNKIGIVLGIDFFSLYSDQKEYKNEGLIPMSANEAKLLHSTIAHQLKILEQQNEILKSEVKYLKKIIALLEEKKKKK